MTAALANTRLFAIIGDRIHVFRKIWTHRQIDLSLDAVGVAVSVDTSIDTRYQGWNS